MKMTCPQSLKFAKLKRRLQKPQYQIIGLLEALWNFTQVNAPAGDIGRHSDEDIATGIEWDGDPSALIEVLVECRWLDRSERYRLIVHDWADHLPGYLKGALHKNGLEIAKNSPTQQPANPTQQPANPTQQPANPTQQPAPSLVLAGLGLAGQPNPPDSDADASGGARARSKPKSKTKTSTDPLFERFWKAYPHKKSRGDAENAFAKLNPGEDRLEELLVIIKRQKLTGCLQPKFVDGRSTIPYPATWINKKCWEDEDPEPVANEKSHYAPFVGTDEPTTAEAANKLRARQGLPAITLNGTAVAS